MREGQLACLEENWQIVIDDDWSLDSVDVEVQKIDASFINLFRFYHGLDFGGILGDGT